MKIVVIGSINMDIVTTTDRFPKVGETLYGISSSVLPGGKGANQAVAASRLGANVEMIGCVGNDNYGQIAIDNLKDNNVGVQGISKVIGETGVANITVTDNDNNIIIVQGANSMVSRDIVNKSMNKILESDIVILQCEIPIDTVEYVLDICLEHNIKSILNPAPAENISIEQSLKASFITPNEIELKQLFNDDLDTVLLKYPQKIIVTHGSKGVYYSDSNRINRIPAFQVDVVDTTGAGDTFNAAFAVGYLNTNDVRKAIEFGNLAASKTVQLLGAQTSMPYITDLV